MMYLKYGRNCLFFCFHCGLIKSAVISTWGESYLKLNITRNAIAALTPFSSMSLALYIIIMVTSTIDFLAYIPSRSQIFIATPKWVSLTSGERGRFFFFFFFLGHELMEIWVLYYDSCTFPRTEIDRNSSFCTKWTKEAALI